MKKAGDICQDCKRFFEYDNLSPQRLVNLYDADGKMISNADGPVAVCPYCDGDRMPNQHHAPAE